MRLKRRVCEKVFNEVSPAAVINTPGTCSSQLSLAAVFVRRARPVYTYIHLPIPFNQLQSLRRIVVTTLLGLAGDTILMNRPRARNHCARNSLPAARRACTRFRAARKGNDTNVSDDKELAGQTDGASRKSRIVILRTRNLQSVDLSSKALRPLR